ncbi:helix-turn-helix domain-containing protein [Galbitalea sp. SE-J8]|uniref:winged helix-turn-helix transcriptional regulator n=1 Tax=Galbitalea sp. SE-J8 TaxID=3054952 RepID=UPI00259C8584|nr:helix-turn-helix domain-containing protein [Galbitalea sp. SE-J8]MDM4763292.1 helix-turn-helix domain-containing protein [Galbitalea sp. SE-J8]
MYAAAHGTDPSCQILRSLEVLGEKWTLLIVRDALKGSTRFGEFRDALKAPTDVLSARLASLVEHGILEKRPYAEPGSRERFSYHLTAAGDGLRLVIAALAQWSDEFDPATGERASVLVDAATGEPARLAFVRADGTAAQRPRLAPGPAASAAWRERYATGLVG